MDTITRSVGPSLTKALNGQAVVIENMPGAGGITGTQAIVKAAPDGNTIGVVSNNHVINPSVYKKMPFDSLADITPIMVVGTTPLVLVVNPTKMPVKDAKEFIAALKAKPGGYNYASSGNGTILHLAAEMFLDQTGTTSAHVPYKGVGAMVTDLLGGQVELGRACAAVGAAASEKRRAARDRHRNVGAHSRRSGHPDHGGARRPGLSGRRLVRRHRPGQAARRRR